MTNKRTYILINNIKHKNLLEWTFSPASYYPLSECAIFTRIVGKEFQWIRLGLN